MLVTSKFTFHSLFLTQPNTNPQPPHKPISSDRMYTNDKMAMIALDSSPASISPQNKFDNLWITTATTVRLHLLPNFTRKIDHLSMNNIF